MHRVMKKKTISSTGAQVFRKYISGRDLQEKTKAETLKKKQAALKFKVQKAALKDKERELVQRKKEKKKMQAALAAARAKEDALLSPEALREKRKLERLVSKDFKEVLKKLVKDDAEEVERGRAETLALPRTSKDLPMDTSDELSEQQLSELNRAVDMAMKIFKDVWLEFVFEYDRGNADGDERDERADTYLETVVAEKYDELRAIMINLLPWVPPLRPNATGDYSVLEFDGYQPPPHLRKGAVNWRLLAAQSPNGEPAMEKVLGASLACWRRDPKFRALEAFCAMTAILSNRKEKSFLEAFATRAELDLAMKKLQKTGVKVQSKTSARRKHEIRVWLETQQHPCGFGYFAHFLVKSHASMRVAFKSGVPASIPVSVIAVERITLFDSLASDDTGDGSFVGAAKSFEWCSQEGTQFAFQAGMLGVQDRDLESRKIREAPEALQPNPELRALLLSRKPIVCLEVVAALAPRDVARSEGLSAIVVAELAQLMRDAKNRGEAVMFCLGSDAPHTLAEKVYLRKPIGDHGLTCGYFRWRKSADLPWAREAHWSDRPCHCLQMP